MKVHFLTSRISLLQDIESLRTIAKIVKDSGHTMDDDWLEEAYEREVVGKQVKADWPGIFKNSIETIAKADVVIAETTFPSFAIGYQVAIAVQQKKPVLLLRHKDSDQNAYITGVEDGWTQYQGYGASDIEQILKKFLDANDITSKDMRFNFFIDRKIYNYLRWAALRTGKTKAEILRELVEKEIDHENGQ
ncbi:MAG TPA: hypothetical protein VJR27_01115 [Candidatus Saccharimonadales bacterium]|nr:hypothetical protein [Candidatus Saccharimonadales bacterium]